MICYEETCVDLSFVKSVVKSVVRMLISDHNWSEVPDDVMTMPMYSVVL